MSRTANADLLRLARERGVELSDRGARKLRARVGDQEAVDRIEALATLINLAASLGRPISTRSAAQRLDACAGSCDTAIATLIYDVRNFRERRFIEELNRREKELYARDAHVRHSKVSVGHGSLGFRTTMLLLAAADADLRKPDVDAYKRQIVAAVQREVRRRYPSRRQEDFEVLDAEQPDSRHRELLQAAIRDERDARDRVLKQLPELQQRIDALARFKTLRNEIEQVLARIQQRVAEKARTDGWEPNPERYRQLVVDAAWEAARAA